MRPLAHARSTALTSLALLAGCAGGSTVQQPVSALPLANARAAAQTIVLTPSSLTFGVSPSHRLAVTITGGSRPYAIGQSNADITDLTAAKRTGAHYTFDVSAVASGVTNVYVKDANGALAAMNVSQQGCTASRPQFGQVFPAPGATAVSTRIDAVYVSEPTGDPMRSQAHLFYARLVASNGSYVAGGFFHATNAAPPHGSAQVPPGNILMRAALPTLRGGLTYRLLYPSEREPCIGPVATGSFTTGR